MLRVISEEITAYRMRSAAPSGSWCGGQRQLSAANGSLVLGSR